MATLKIPIDTTSFDQEFSMELEGVVYVFRFTYNSRSDRWTFRVSKEDGTLIVAGLPLITRYPLLTRFSNPDLPPGTLFVIDESGADLEAVQSSWGSTHNLYYRESTDGGI